jgi:hypothetical protein
MSLFCVVEPSFVVVGKLGVRFSGLAVEIQQVQGHGDDISNTIVITNTSSPHLYRAQRLKVPKREIFDRSDSPDFYTIKSSWVGDLLVKILTYYFNF